MQDTHPRSSTRERRSPIHALRFSEPDVLHVPAVADLLGVRRQTVSRWIREDRIPYLEPEDEHDRSKVPLYALLATLHQSDDLSREIAVEHNQARVHRQPAAAARQCRRMVARFAPAALARTFGNVQLGRLL
jgi:hypothetical protein